MKWLINTTATGKLTSFHKAAVDEIVSMSSYRGHQFFPSLGDTVKRTENCFSWMGCVMTVNKSSDTLEEHYRRYGSSDDVAIVCHVIYKALSSSVP